MIRKTGLPVFWSISLPIHRFTGRPVHRFTGFPVHRFTDRPVYQSTGLPVHRSPRKPVHRSPIYKIAGLSIRIGPVPETFGRSGVAMAWWRDRGPICIDLHGDGMLENPFRDQGSEGTFCMLARRRSRQNVKRPAATMMAAPVATFQRIASPKTSTPIKLTKTSWK